MGQIKLDRGVQRPVLGQVQPDQGSGVLFKAKSSQMKGSGAHIWSNTARLRDKEANFRSNPTGWRPILGQI